MNFSIRLGFLTSDNKSININIPRANPAVTGADVRDAMERILNAHIIATAAGEPSVIDQANLISTEELDYDF